jgi:hypothetical protein
MALPSCERVYTQGSPRRTSNVSISLGVRGFGGSQKDSVFIEIFAYALTHNTV